MFNKKVFFIICLLIIFITTSATYADDNLNSNDVVVCADDIKTFDDVQDLLASPNTHNEVFLKNTTYVANSNKPININSNLLIYGSNHIVDTKYSTIDAKGLTTVFNIAENCTVKLSNINIINSKSTSSGAVVIGKGSVVYISNVNFINNDGGAITVNPDATVICENDNFINNSAVNGGAIYGAGNIKVNNSYFYNNIALINGGAIYGTSNINVINSRFFNNKADNGGAVGGYENVNIVNSIFNENLANTGGGAIFVVKSLNVIDSTFNRNIAGFGGAIAVETDISQGAIQTATVSNSLFTNNVANNGPGAAIYATGTLTVSDSSFESKNCKGGSVIFVPTEGSIVSKNNLFASDLPDTNLRNNLVVTTDRIIGNTVRLYIYVPFYSEGDIIVSLNRIELQVINNTLDKSFYVVDVNNLVSGVNNISIRYRGDDKFVSSVVTVPVDSQTKPSINLDVIVPTISYKQNATIYISSSINGVVDVRVGNLLFDSVNIKDNKAIISVPNLDAGNYLVEVIYKGDSVYGAKTASSILTVNKANSTLVVTSSVSGKNGVIRIISNMPGNFIILLNGKQYTTIYTNNGNSTFTIPKLGGGEYVVTVISNNSNYVGAKATTTFSITDIITITLLNTEVYYSLSTIVQAFADRINPSTGVEYPLSLVNLIFTINGQNYTVKTDNKGDASLQVNLTAGYYPVTVRLENQEGYNCYSVEEGYINIKPLIMADDIIVDSKNFTYSAELVDSDGNPVADKEMAFVINGIIKRAVTDVNGVASVVFNDVAAGTYEMLISANNYAIKHTVTVLPVNMSSLVVTASVNSNKADITVTLSESVTNAVMSFDVNGVIYNVSFNGNVANLRLDNLANNLYRVTATLICKDFAPISNVTSFRINIPRGELFIETDPVEINYKQIANILVKIHNELNEPLSNFIVVVSINGKDYTKATDANGIARFSISNLNAGFYKVFVECQGDNVYHPKTIESSVKVSPLNMSSMVLSSTVDYNDVVVTASFSENVDGKVIFRINGVEYIESISGNKAVLKVTLPKTGTYTVTATLNSVNYNPISNTTKFVIKTIRGEIVLTAPNVEMYYHDGTKFVVKVTDGANTPLNGIKIRIKLNGVWYDRVTKDGGIASMSVNLGADFYEVVVNYPGDKIYHAKTIESSILIKSTIIEEDFTKIFRNASQFLATFLDDKGNPVVGLKASFNINGVFYERTTNATGGTKFNINLAPGTYILTAMNPFNGEQRSVTVTVLPNMISHNVTKYFRNETQYSIQLLDNQGRPAAKGTSVTFNINGVFYERTAKENGIANLNINLVPGTYILTAIYNNLMVSSTVKVLSTIVSNDLTMASSAREPFVVKALDKKGKPAAIGSKLSFNINGVIYNRIINNAQGTAQLNINLLPGIYIITTMYDDLMQANTIKITSN